MNILIRFQEAIRNLVGCEEGINVAIAVSGGSDSLALCILMDEWVRKISGKLTCLTIDHGLRPESKIEAVEVGEILAKYDINHQIITWTGVKPQANLQENARIARYNLLTEYCLQHKISILATGHQLNDQAENFILRAEYGSGVYGLAGIPEVNNINQVKIIRPLLNFTRTELQNFLNERNIVWIEDPSNKNEKFARVRARKIIDNHPELLDILSKLTKKMAHAKEAIEYMIIKSMQEIVTYFPDHVVIKQDAFKELPQEVRFRILMKILQMVSGNEKPARAERIENLLDKITQGFKASTLGGCLVISKKENIIIKKETLNDVNC